MISNSSRGRRRCGYAVPSAAISIFLLGGSVAAVADGFTLGMSTDEIRRMSGDTFFSDSAVGEEAYMKIADLCRTGEQLFLIANRAISTDHDNDAVTLKFKREPQLAVSASIEIGSEKKRSEVAKWFSAFGIVLSCDARKALFQFEPQLFPIVNIDGRTDLKSLIAATLPKIAD